MNHVFLPILITSPGSGSHSSLLPGYCTPVILFVFLDDFIDIKASSSSSEDLADDSSLSQSSGSSSIAKPGLPVKGSGSVVMLARPISKSEGGFRKKLQSSLEAQIRFLVKKCRVLTGSEITHGGSRGGGVSGAAPLFSLDASRAVAFVDRSANQKGKPLEFVSNLVEEILNGKATSDSLLHENLSQSASQEDTLSVKEFIYRQSDILKGRGGSVGGSAAGAGMVAVAAAAAAASASSGKSLNTPGPELPKIEIWLNSSQFILQGLLSARRGFMDNSEVSKFSYPLASSFDLTLHPLKGTGLTEETELFANELESNFFEGEEIHLSEIACEQIFLEIPIQPLCQEACKGLCPNCGKDLNFSACDCIEKEIGTGFNVLKKLKLQ